MPCQSAPNLVNFHAPFFTNHVYFTPHDRPPLLKGHQSGVAFIGGSTVFQTLTMTLQGKHHGYGYGQDHTVSPASN